MILSANKSQAQYCLTYETKNELNFDYKVQASGDAEDLAWDTFVEHTAGSCYKQTSLWSKERSGTGWRPIRIYILQVGQIKAGVQVLYRQIPFFGNIGEAVHAPIFSSGDPQLINLVLDELVKATKEHNIRLLHIQPPYQSYNSMMDTCLQSRPEFYPSVGSGLVDSTLVIDLSPDLDDILAQTHKSTRKRIRKAQTKGITVREGMEGDLSTFYRLLTATAQRQDFTPEPEEYYTRLWQTLAPHGFIKLFMAEYLGEALSASLAIPFRDTVTAKRRAWSGEHSELSPNEALVWGAITWAKSQGYLYYDFDGIERGAAKALLKGEPIPETGLQNVTSFKIGFGGKPILYPQAYNLIPNPVLRLGYRTIFLKVRDSQVFLRLLKYLRTH